MLGGLLRQPVSGIIVIFCLVGVADFYIHANAETGKGHDVFSVLVTVFGIKNDTGKIVAFVSVRNTTQANVIDISTPAKKDGIIEQYFTFPGVPVPVGEKYRACIMVLQDLDLKCNEGHNSFVQRGEYIELVLNKTK